MMCICVIDRENMFISWFEFFLLLAIFVSGIFAVRKLSRIVFRKYRVSLFATRVQRMNELLSSLYGNEENPYYVSLHFREEHHIDGEQFTYGEILPSSFAQLLNLTSPVAGEIFYDLGCGSGKAVFCAPLCFPFLKAKGVELLPPLFEYCSKLKNQFMQLVTESKYFKKNVPSVEFFQGDLLNVDFSDGNIFFLNATCFRDDDWNNLIKKLSALPVGVRVIIVTRHLENEAFELIETGTYSMSWGFSSVFIYRKTR